MENEIREVYGNRVRIRACGLCWQGDRLLLLNHRHLGPANFWSPPGGGIDFGQSAEETVVREFAEESGISVEVGTFRFAAEFIRPPLHAIELFFEVATLSGTPTVGTDPETHLQLLTDAQFMTWSEIQQMPAHERHGIFSIVKSADDLRKLSGCIRLL